jgi:hypothetical protein
MNYFVYAVLLLVIISMTIFIKTALFNRRPQKFGLILALIAIPLYLVYYNDRFDDLLQSFFNNRYGHLRMRDVVSPLDTLGQGADSRFVSDIAPSLLVAGIILVHLTVFQRVAVRRRLQRVADPIANFFAGAVAATLVGGTLVSTFHWGWIGAVVVAVVFALVYLGALALLGAIIEVFAALSKLFLVWLKRKAFAVATWITRVSSWISSLSGRLVSRAWIEQIRQDTANQESLFLQEQDAQDRALYEAYLRDRNRKRRLLQARGVKVPDLEDSFDAGNAITAAGGLPPAVLAQMGSTEAAPAPAESPAEAPAPAATPAEASTAPAES